MTPDPLLTHTMSRYRVLGVAAALGATVGGAAYLVAGSPSGAHVTTSTSRWNLTTDTDWEASWETTCQSPGEVAATRADVFADYQVDASGLHGDIGDVFIEGADPADPERPTLRATGEVATSRLLCRVPLYRAARLETEITFDGDASNEHGSCTIHGTIKLQLVVRGVGTLGCDALRAHVARTVSAKTTASIASHLDG